MAMHTKGQELIMHLKMRPDNLSKEAAELIADLERQVYNLELEVRRLNPQLAAEEMEAAHRKIFGATH